MERRCGCRILQSCAGFAHAQDQVRLQQLTCRTPDMVAKEIDMGIAAYNLVRAVTCLTSG